MVSELEQENAALRARLAELEAVLSTKIQDATGSPGVLIALPAPKELAFGQRWALVFTIGPNNTREPSIDDLFCPIIRPDGKQESYMALNETFAQEDVPHLGHYLGMVSGI